MWKAHPRGCRFFTGGSEYALQQSYQVSSLLEFFPPNLKIISKLPGLVLVLVFPQAPTKIRVGITLFPLTAAKTWRWSVSLVTGSGWRVIGILGVTPCPHIYLRRRETAFLRLHLAFHSNWLNSNLWCLVVYPQFGASKTPITRIPHPHVSLCLFIDPHRVLD